MKAIQLLLTVAVASLALMSTATARSGWMTDIDAALAKAKKEKKSVLVEFTG